MARHLPLISDMSELAALFHKSSSVQAFLQEMVELVARHMSTQVASIYLLHHNDLVLKATHGLSGEAINTLHIPLGEGLVGKAIKELRPILDNKASSNPSFKRIEGLDTDAYDSFLAVPIFRGTKRTGVLSVQRDINHPFDEYDVLALSAITSQLGMLIEQAHVLLGARDQFSPPRQDRHTETTSFHKAVKVASRGYAYGRLVEGREHLWPPVIPDTLPDCTLADFEQALAHTVEQLENLQKEVEETLSDVASLIFTSHLLMLKDPSFTGKMHENIQEGKHPLHAVCDVVNSYRDIFASSQNPAMQEKVQDITDLGNRLVNNLLYSGVRSTKVNQGIVVARELAPSEILTLSAEGVKGVVLVGGGITSHVAILARSLHIPLVISDDTSLLHLPPSTEILIGNKVVWIKPPPEIIAEYEGYQQVESTKQTNNIQRKLGPLQTKDGREIKLDVNINLVTDVTFAKPYAPDGIGLYRTEFPFMLRSSLPTEEEQYTIFKQVATGMPGVPVTIRTLDVGGDKMMAYYDSPREENPFLGLRSIRFALEHRELFRDHLRAILRAGTGCELKIMFPVISSLEEVFSAKRAVVEAIGSLVAEGIPCNTNPQTGIMIEVPSVLEIINELAAEVDFFCLGTNDFVQYMLCVDRTNELVADFYCSHHPSVIRGLYKVVTAATKAGIELSLCGDMAHQPEYIPLLLGLGVRRFSVDGAYLSSTRELIESSKYTSAKEMVSRALTCSAIDDIADVLNIPERYHIGKRGINFSI